MARELDMLEHGLRDVLSQNGTIYKREELENFQQAIDTFRASTGIVTPPPEPPSQEELDRFADMLENTEGYVPPSAEEQQKLNAMIEEMRANGELDDFK